MYWNKKELNTLFETRTPKHEGSLRSREVYYCKLIANCLTIAHANRKKIDIIVLENSQIKETQNNGFRIYFQQKLRYEFWADDELKQKQWIEALSNASYQGLKNKIKNFEDEIEELNKQNLELEKLLPSPEIKPEIECLGNQNKPQVKVMPFCYGNQINPGIGKWSLGSQNKTETFSFDDQIEPKQLNTPVLEPEVQEKVPKVVGNNFQDIRKCFEEASRRQKEQAECRAKGQVRPVRPPRSRDTMVIFQSQVTENCQESQTDGATVQTEVPVDDLIQF